MSADGGESAPRESAVARAKALAGRYDADVAEAVERYRVHGDLTQLADEMESISNGLAKRSGSCADLIRAARELLIKVTV